MKRYLPFLFLFLFFILSCQHEAGSAGRDNSLKQAQRDEFLDRLTLDLTEDEIPEELEEEKIEKKPEPLPKGPELLAGPPLTYQLSFSETEEGSSIVKEVLDEDLQTPLAPALIKSAQDYGLQKNRLIDLYNGALFDELPMEALVYIEPSRWWYLLDKVWTYDLDFKCHFCNLLVPEILPAYSQTYQAKVVEDIPTITQALTGDFSLPINLAEDGAHPDVAYDPGRCHFLVTWEESKNIYAKVLDCTDGQRVIVPKTLLTGERINQGAIFPGFGQREGFDLSMPTPIKYAAPQVAFLPPSNRDLDGLGSFLIVYESHFTGKIGSERIIWPEGRHAYKPFCRSITPAEKNFSLVFGKMMRISADNARLEAYSSQWEEGLPLSKVDYGRASSENLFSKKRNVCNQTEEQGDEIVRDIDVRAWVNHERAHVVAEPERNRFLVVWQTNNDYKDCFSVSYEDDCSGEDCPSSSENGADRLKARSVYGRLIEPEYGPGRENPDRFSIYADSSTLNEQTCAPNQTVTSAEMPRVAYDSETGKFLVVFESAKTVINRKPAIAGRLFGFQGQGSNQLSPIAHPTRRAKTIFFLEGKASFNPDVTLLNNQFIVANDILDRESQQGRLILHRVAINGTDFDVLETTPPYQPDDSFVRRPRIASVDGEEGLELVLSYEKKDSFMAEESSIELRGFNNDFELVGEGVTMSAADAPFNFNQEIAPRDDTLFAVWFASDGQDLNHVASSLLINQAPVARITDENGEPFSGNQISIVSGESLKIYGERSSDFPDPVTQLNFSWSPAHHFDNPNSVNPTFTAPMVESSELIQVQLIVSDTGSLSSLPVTLRVRVAPPNQPPVAKIADLPDSFYEGVRVELSAAESFDSEDGVDLIYQWSGPAQIQFENQDQVTTSFVTPLVDGDQNFNIRLKVIDSEGLFDEDVVRVHVLDNQKPEAHITFEGETTLRPGQSLVFNGEGSLDPEDDNNIAYQWSQVGEIPDSLNPKNQVRATFVAPEVATEKNVVIELVVTDSKGLSSLPASVSLNLLPLNQRPTANITRVAPLEDPIISGDTVRLSAQGSSDPDDGLSLNYLWRGPPEINLITPDRFETSFLAPIVLNPTTYTIFLKVVDQEGSESEEVSFGVTVQPNQPPIAKINIISGKTTLRPGDKIVLTGVASQDPEDLREGLNYYWSQSEEVSLSLNPVDQFQTTFTAPQVDAATAVTISLKVKDTKGLESLIADTLSLTILPPNQKPVAQIISVELPSPLIEGDRVILSAQGSSDSDDGANLTYQWSAPAPVALDATILPEVHFNAPTVTQETSYNISLVVTDREGLASDVARFQITVHPNQLPIAIIDVVEGGSRLRPGQTTKLTGVRSSDPEGEQIAAYQWSQSNEVSQSLSVTSGSETVFTAPVVSQQTRVKIFLVVVDGRGKFSQSVEKILTLLPHNEAPTANITLVAAPDPIIEGDTIRFSAEGSSDSDDGTDLTYQWSGSPEINLTQTNQFEVSIETPAVDTTTDFVLNLIVTDRENLPSQQATFAFIVEPNLGATGDIFVKSGSTTLRPGQSVTLSAENIIDPEGGSLTYAWSQSNEVPLALNATNRLETIFTAPIVDTLTNVIVSLVATDERGQLSDPVSIQLTLRPPNEPPVANITAESLADPLIEGELVRLSARGSNDSDDGVALDYAWSLPPGFVALTPLNQFELRFRTPNVDQETDYTVSLVVTDQESLSSQPFSFIVRVVPNQKPVADIAIVSGSTSLRGGESLTLSGIGSSDPEEERIDSFEWSQTTQLPLSLTATTERETTFVAPAVDVLTVVTVSLVVTDQRGDKSIPATLQITVRPLNQKPVANITPINLPNPLIEGDVVRLSAQGSGDSDDGTNITYQWSAPAPIILSNTNQFELSFSAPNVAIATNYDISLVATDQEGLSSDPFIFRITVKPNQTPLAHIALLEGGTSLRPSQTLKLTGIGSSDPEGEGIASYQWSQSNEVALSLNATDQVETIFTAPLVSSETNVTISLLVVDARGDVSSVAQTFEVLVLPPNEKPMANITAVQLSNPLIEGDLVRLSAQGSSDSDDGVNLTYQWSATAGITLNNNGLFETNFTAPNVDAATDYTISLVVIDAEGLASEPANFVVTVQQNQIPTAQIDIVAGGLFLTSGETITLTGANSSDPEDGANLTYQWSQSNEVPLSLDNATGVQTLFTAPNVDVITSVTISLIVMDTRGEVSGVAALQLTLSPPNRPPNKPTLILPGDNNLLPPTRAYLEWSATDPDEGIGDTLTYKVRLDENDPPITEIASCDGSATNCYADIEVPNGIYYWQVVAIDSVGNETASDVFTLFTDDSLLGRWLFDQAGILVTDVSGKGNNGRFIAPRATPSLVNNGDVFLGAPVNNLVDSGIGFSGDDYLRIDSLSASGRGQMAIEIWFRTDRIEAGREYELFAMRDELFGAFFGLPKILIPIIGNSGKVQCSFIPGSTFTVTSSSSLVEDQMTHLVCQFGAGGIEMFVDGLSNDSRGDIFAFPSESGFTEMGWNSLEDAGHLSGIIDEVVIYNRKLGNVEIQNSFKAH